MYSHHAWCINFTHHAYHVLDAPAVVYNGTSVVGCVSCASVKESMRIGVRFPLVAYFGDVKCRAARSLHVDPKWRGVHSNEITVAKDQ